MQWATAVLAWCPDDGGVPAVVEAAASTAPRMPPVGQPAGVQCRQAQWLEGCFWAVTTHAWPRRPWLCGHVARLVSPAPAA